MNDIKDRFALLILETAQEEKERRSKEKTAREKELKKIEEIGICEGWCGPCDNKKGVSWISSMTYYFWDIDKYPLEDPNRELFFCPGCAKDYTEGWTDRWNDYYSGLL